MNMKINNKLMGKLTGKEQKFLSLLLWDKQMKLEDDLGEFSDDKTIKKDLEKDLKITEKIMDKLSW